MLLSQEVSKSTRSETGGSLSYPGHGFGNGKKDKENIGDGRKAVSKKKKNTQAFSLIQFWLTNIY